MRNKCTVDAITTPTSDILNGFENNKYTPGMFLDLSKAFDEINHKIFLKKFQKYGINGNA